MNGELCYIIYIFDQNKKKNRVLQTAYGRIFATNFTVVNRVVKLVFPSEPLDTEYTVINSCHYKGKYIKEAIGLTENYRLYPELGALSNIPEEIGTYIPSSSKIKTASYSF